MKTRGRTDDKTADFLLRQIRIFRRMGDYEHKRDADRWEAIIRQHAVPEPQPMAVNFAAPAEPTGAAMER